ncbi:IS30 family transposase [Actinokineospora guangxiensis]|uniref:IS30 family transposase n=1 Tax=Actinokineospora guangxiensis TaxID=1490288 RepID=A0ABW0EY16_9PSEU
MLTLADREEISRGLAESLEFRDIAVRIGRDASVVSREIRRHGGRDGYRAVQAERVAEAARSRPKAMAVTRCPRLFAAVVEWLRRGWSPGSIAGRVACDHGGRDACRVSHEAIYQWVYAQPVATLRRELVALRSGRTARRGPRPAPAPRIKEPRYLDERPAEAAGRAVPGHWEGDLVIGKSGKTAVATLVERTSRFLILVPLTGRDSLTVSEAVIAAVGPLPTSLKRSLTWDCGSEMALHAEVTATGLPVYFAHPHSPWERGSNENLNRIVREFLPKGVTIPSDPRYMAAIAAEINDRPRKIHDWKKPSEVFTELLASHASTA